MRANIIKKPDSSGLGETLQFSSYSGSTELLSWSVALAGREILTQWAHDSVAYGVIANSASEASGYQRTLGAAFYGPATPSPTACTVVDFTPILNPTGLIIATDSTRSLVQGRLIANGSYTLATVNVSATEASVSYQPQTAQEIAQNTTMTFEDGHCRVITISSDATTMSLSTIVGDGTGLDIALTIPLTAPVLDQDNVSGSIVAMVLALYGLADAAESQGLGVVKDFGPWFIIRSAPGVNGGASPAHGQVAARNEDGIIRACFGAENGAGLDLYEIMIKSASDYEQVYSGSLANPSGWVTPTYRVSLDEIPENPPFWTNFVSSFEEIDSA
jgi:hypothetical protein